MAISKRLRHEVMRRDGYVCQLCRTTDGELTVDHVVPRALGGSDDPSNLQTLCISCNAGKSSVQPDAAMVAEVDAKAARWADAMERVAQRERADLAKSGELISAFDKHWCSWTSRNEPLPRPGDWEQSVLSMRDAGMDLDGLCDAVGIAMAAQHIRNNATWRYFCGVVWRKLQQRQKAARDLLALEAAERTSAPTAPTSRVDDDEEEEWEDDEADDPYEQEREYLTEVQERFPLERMRSTKPYSDENFALYGRIVSDLHAPFTGYWFFKRMDGRPSVLHAKDRRERRCFDDDRVSFAAWRTDLMPMPVDHDAVPDALNPEIYCEVCCVRERAKHWPASFNGKLYSDHLRENEAWMGKSFFPEALETAERAEWWAAQAGDF